MRQTGRLVKLPNPHRNELGIVASGFNQLATQVEEQKGRLREHIVELQRLNTELQEMGKLKDDFLATISHQFRTPVMTLIEGLELMRDEALGALSDDQRLFVQRMHENAKQLSGLVEKALALSLLQSTRKSLTLQSADLAGLLHQVHSNWQAVAASRTLRLECGVLPPAYVDVHAIHHVMDQLVSNALRHSPERSEVVLEARALDEVIEVSVRDHGQGLSDEQIAQLFQPFVHI